MARSEPTLMKTCLVTADVPIPERAYIRDAGLDLSANCDYDVGQELAVIPLGIKVAIPPYYAGLLYLRSSWTLKGLVQPSTGVIDCGYAGEIKLVVFAPWNKVSIRRGDRIAQLVVHKIAAPIADVTDAENFDKMSAHRGSRGFGSSGVRPFDRR